MAREIKNILINEIHDRAACGECLDIGCSRKQYLGDLRAVALVLPLTWEGIPILRTIASSAVGLITQSTAGILNRLDRAEPLIWADLEVARAADGGAPSV